MELEQKAEEYAEINSQNGEFLYFNNKKYISLDDAKEKIKKAYNNGFKKGQKDTFNIYDNEVKDISNDYSNRLKNLEKENEELKAQIEKMKCCKSEILQRIDESCIGALNEEVRVIFKKWELAE